MSLININLPVTVKSENSKVIVQSPDVDTVHTTIEPNNITIKGPDASQGVSSTTTLIGGKISGLNAPTDNNDAANKKYVDDAVKGGGGGVKVIGPTKITGLGAGNGFCTVLDFGTSYLFIIRLLLCTMSAQKYAVAYDIPSLYVSSFNGMAPTAMGQTGKTLETIFTFTHDSNTNTVYIQPASNGLPSGDSGTIVFWANKE